MKDRSEQQHPQVPYHAVTSPIYIALVSKIVPYKDTK